jgi:hypothetical protein
MKTYSDEAFKMPVRRAAQLRGLPGPVPDVAVITDRASTVNSSARSGVVTAGRSGLTSDLRRLSGTWPVLLCETAARARGGTSFLAQFGPTHFRFEDCYV